METTWIPLDEKIAEEVEKEHLVKFKNEKIIETAKSDTGKGPLPGKVLLCNCQLY